MCRGHLLDDPFVVVINTCLSGQLPNHLVKHLHIVTASRYIAYLKWGRIMSSVFQNSGRIITTYTMPR